MHCELINKLVEGYGNDLNNETGHFQRVWGIWSEWTGRGREFSSAGPVSDDHTKWLSD